jgi:hypothetical protein
MVQLNRWALKRIKHTRSSHHKRIPRVDYSGGITKMTNIASHEWPGILLVYLLAASSPSGRLFLLKHFDDKDSKFDRKVEHQKKKEETKRKRQKILSEEGLLTKGEQLQGRKEESQVDIVNHTTTKNNQVADPGEGKIARCTIDKFVEMCESLLCFHAYYKQEKYWKVYDQHKVVKQFDAAVRTMMSNVITTMDRGTNTNN